MGGSSKGGGGSSASKTYDFYGSIAGGFCSGPLHKLTGIEVDDDLLWSGSLLRVDEPNPVIVNVPDRGAVHVFWGTEDQLTPHSLLNSGGNGLAHQHPAYTGDCYAVLVNWKFGRERTTMNNIRLHGVRETVQSMITGAAASLIDDQANPYCVIAEAFTNQRYGRGMPLSLFAVDAWQAAADALVSRASSTYVSVFIDKQESGKAMGLNMLRLCDGWIRAQKGTGLAEAGLYPPPESIVAAALPLIDSSVLTEKPKWEPETWDDITTRTVVTYRNRGKNFKQLSEKYDDPRARLGVGTSKTVNIRSPFIVRPGQAREYAQNEGRKLGIPGLTGSLSVRAPRVADVQAGSHVRVDIDPEPGGSRLDKVCRVKSIRRPATGPASIELEGERTLAAILVQSPGDPEPPQVVEVDDIANVRFFEVPPPFSDFKELAVGILASRPEGLVTDCAVFYDSEDDVSSTFPVLGGFRNFALRGKLSAAYSESAIGVVGVEILDDVGREIIADNPGDVAARNDDLVMFVFGALDTSDGGYIQPVEAFSVAELVAAGTNLLNVTALRARGGTVALTHLINAEVWFIRREVLPWFRHKDFPTRADSGEPCQFKLQPSTWQAVRPIEDCDPRPFTFDSVRTYAPIVQIQTPQYDPGESFASVSTGGSINFAARITDADSNLVQVQLLRSEEGVETPLMNRTFDPLGDTSFSQLVTFPTAGITVIILRAVDTTNRVVISRTTVRVGFASPYSLVVTALSVPDSPFPSSDWWQTINSDPDSTVGTIPVYGTVFVSGGTGPYSIEPDPIYGLWTEPLTIMPTSITSGKEFSASGVMVDNANAFAVVFYTQRDPNNSGHWRFKVTDSLGHEAYSAMVYADVSPTYTP